MKKMLNDLRGKLSAAKVMNICALLAAVLLCYLLMDSNVSQGLEDVKDLRKF